MTCDNCGNAIDNPIIVAGRHFCARGCSEQFFITRKANQSNNSAGELLTAQEVQTIELSQNELIVNMSHEEMINHLMMIKRNYQELRARERITHSKLNKLIALGETEKTERYRKLGVSSDLEAKKKVHSVLQKSIISYRKMGLTDEKIHKMLVEQMEMEVEKVNIAFKEL
jgi:DNA-binding transcriptional regulator YhcF (GntR family)